MCLAIYGNQRLTIGKGLISIRARHLSAQQLLSPSKRLSVRFIPSPVTQAVLPLHSASLAAITATQLPAMLQSLASPATMTVTVFGLVAVYAWRHARKHSRRSELILQRTPFNQGVLSRCPTMNSVYQTWPFLSNGHVETIFASKLRRNPEVSYTRESFKTPDGGTVHIDYHNLPSSTDLPDDAPVLILLPGLTGGSHDSYVRHMVGAASKNGMRSVVFNSRGTSDGPVTSPQFYSASYTEDMRRVVQMVKKRYPSQELLAAGWSLGGNILVRYLGEEGDRSPISAAASLCNPLDLAISDDNFHVGFNKIYDVNLARSLRNIFKRHAHLFKGLEAKYDLKMAENATSIREFDDAITRVTFGWPSVDAYYYGSSSSHSIPNVKIPLLCLQAGNDPIAPAKAIPYEAIRDNPNCMLALTPSGGHLGWVSGPGAPLGAPWSTQAVVEWMVSVQLELLRSGRSKRMTEQLSDKAINKVASADSVGLNANGNGNAPSGLVKKGTSVEQHSQ